MEQPDPQQPQEQSLQENNPEEQETEIEQDNSNPDQQTKENSVTSEESSKGNGSEHNFENSTHQINQLDLADDLNLNLYEPNPNQKSLYQKYSSLSILKEKDLQPNNNNSFPALSQDDYLSKFSCLSNSQIESLESYTKYLQSQIQQPGTLKKFWKEPQQTFTPGFLTYDKDPDKIITNILEKSYQGALFQSISKTTSQKQTIKQFYDKNDYKREKQIYEYLSKNTQKFQDYIDLENLKFDDKHQLIILPQPDSNLFDFMLQKHENHLKSLEHPLKPEELLTNYHLKPHHKHFILSLLLFILEAHIQLESQYLIYQDLKPQKIGLKKLKSSKNNPEFKFILLDPGVCYLKNKKLKDFAYSSIYSEFYQHQQQFKDLKASQQTNPKKPRKFIKYSEKDIIEDFIFSVFRTLQGIMYPYFLVKNPFQAEKTLQNDLFQEKNLENFIQNMQNHFQIPFKEIFSPNRDKDYSLYQHIMNNLQIYLYKQKIDTRTLQSFTPKPQPQHQPQTQPQTLKSFAFFSLLYQSEKLDQLIQQGITYHINNFKLQSLIILQIVYSHLISDPKTHTKKLQSVCYHLGSLNQQFQNYEKASKYYQFVIEISHDQNTKNTSEYANSLNNLGIIYQQQKFYESAENCFIQSVYIKERLALKDLKYAHTLHNLASVQSQLGYQNSAIEYYNKAIQIYEKNFGKHTHQAIKSLNDLALLYQKTQQLDKALFSYEKALKIQEKNDLKVGLKQINTLKNLAQLYQKKALFQNAIELNEKILTILDQKYGKYSLFHIEILQNLAEIYQNQQEYKKQITILEKILKNYENHYKTKQNDEITLHILNENLQFLYELLSLSSENYDHHSETLLKKFYEKAYEYYNVQELEQSMVIYKQILEIVQQLYQENPSQQLQHTQLIFNVFTDLGKKYIQKAQKEYASTCFRIALDLMEQIQQKVYIDFKLHFQIFIDSIIQLAVENKENNQNNENLIEKNENYLQNDRNTVKNSEIQMDNNQNIGNYHENNENQLEKHQNMIEIDGNQVQIDQNQVQNCLYKEKQLENEQILPEIDQNYQENQIQNDCFLIIFELTEFFSGKIINNYSDQGNLEEALIGNFTDLSLKFYNINEYEYAKKSIQKLLQLIDKHSGDQLINFYQFQSQKLIDILSEIAHNFTENQQNVEASGFFYQICLDYIEFMYEKIKNSKILLQNLDSLGQKFYQIHQIQSTLNCYKKAFSYIEAIYGEIDSKIYKQQSQTIVNTLKTLANDSILTKNNNDSMLLYDQILQIFEKIYETTYDYHIFLSNFQDFNLESLNLGKIDSIQTAFTLFLFLIEEYFENLQEKDELQHNLFQKIKKQAQNFRKQHQIEELFIYYIQSLNFIQNIQKQQQQQQNYLKTTTILQSFSKSQQLIENYYGQIGVNFQQHTSGLIEQILEFAQQYIDQNEEEKTQYYFEIVEKILDDIYSQEKENKNLGKNYEELAHSYLKIGIIQNALQCFQKCFTLIQNIYGTDSSKYEQYYKYLLNEIKSTGKTYKNDQKNIYLAVCHFRATIDLLNFIWQQIKDQDLIVSTCKDLFDEFFSLGQIEECTKCYRNELSLIQSLYGKEDPMYIKYAQNLVYSMMNQGIQYDQESNQSKNAQNSFKISLDLLDTIYDYNLSELSIELSSQKAQFQHEKSLKITKNAAQTNRDLQLDEKVYQTYLNNLSQDSLNHLAFLYYYKNQPRTSFKFIQKALYIQKTQQQQQKEEDEQQQQQFLYNKALLIQLKNPKKALKIYKFLSKQDPNNAKILLNIAILYQKTQKYNKSLLYLQKTQDTYTSPQESLYNLLNLAYISFKKGNLTDSLCFYKELLSIKGQFYLLYSISLNNIAFIYNITGKTEESFKYLKKTQILLEQTDNQNTIQYALVLHNLAYSFYRQGQEEDSINYYQNSLKIQENIENSKFYQQNTLNQLGYIFKNQEKTEKSLGYYEKSLEILENNYFPNKEYFFDTLYNLISIHFSQKNNEKSSFYLQKLQKFLNFSEENLKKHCQKQQRYTLIQSYNQQKDPELNIDQFEITRASFNPSKLRLSDQQNQTIEAPLFKQIHEKNLQTQIFFYQNQFDLDKHNKITQIIQKLQQN